MKYKIKLKYAGRTVRTIETEDLDEDELNKKTGEVLDTFATNRFTKNLHLELEVIPI